MKKSIIISTLLCVLMCITTFTWATDTNSVFGYASSGNFTDTSIDNSETVSIDINGTNSGDIHIGNDDATVAQDEMDCKECLKATFDGSSMVLILPKVEYFDPELFKVTTWFMEMDLSTGEAIITDTYPVE